MSERTGRRLVVLALFAASMVLPTNGMQVLGYRVALASAWGTAWGSPICILGFLGNLLFLVAAVLLVTRLARGKPKPSFATAFPLTIIALVMMAAAWISLESVWLRTAQTHSWLTLGPLAWVASAVVMVIGSWALRSIDATRSGARGFEVIPLNSES